jgi:hypothetical protein
MPTKAHLACLGHVPAACPLDAAYDSQTDVLSSPFLSHYRSWLLQRQRPRGGSLVAAQDTMHTTGHNEEMVASQCHDAHLCAAGVVHTNRLVKHSMV